MSCHPGSFLRLAYASGYLLPTKCSECYFSKLHPCQQNSRSPLLNLLFVSSQATTAAELTRRRLSLWLEPSHVTLRNLAVAGSQKEKVRACVSFAPRCDANSTNQTCRIHRYFLSNWPLLRPVHRFPSLLLVYKRSIEHMVSCRQVFVSRPRAAEFCAILRDPCVQNRKRMQSNQGRLFTESHLWLATHACTCAILLESTERPS